VIAAQVEKGKTQVAREYKMLLPGSQGNNF